MSRVTPFRATVATGLTLGTAVVGLAFAPAAFAAPAPTVTLSSTTVAPGAEYTVSGTGCLPGSDGEPGVWVIVPNVDEPQSADYDEANTDGTWTTVEYAPTDLGSYEYNVFCDAYATGFDYPNITITVTADGKPVPAPVTPTATPVDEARGTKANTPGVGANKAATATNDTLAAPGEKVVRVYKGFQPFEVVRVTLHSTPQNVGVFTADASGTVTVSFTVPAGTPVSDDHTLVLVGDKGTYFQEAFEVAAVGDARLAYTGASVGLPLALGAGLLVAGGGVLVATRRRNSGVVQA